MNRARSLATVTTVAVIFGVGLVVGLWLNRNTGTQTPPSPPIKTYAPLEESENVVMRVYREVSPAVVNIVTRSLAFNFWMQPTPQTGQGTGFVLDVQGHILTNNHVIGQAKDLEVTFKGGTKVKAELIGQDPVSDLAVIKVAPYKGMNVAKLGSSENLSVGQRVVAIGNPFGFQNTVTAGFISALDRDILIGDRTLMGLIQTDAAINPGNSGGPLINAAGEVIGINSAIYTKSGGSIGIGLAMPIDRAKKVAAQIIKWGRAIYPWLGVKSAMNLNPELATQMGLAPIEGVLIFEVAAGSPAAEAGLHGGVKVAYYRMRPILLGGDVILAVNGTKTPTWDDYRNALFEKDIGETVSLELLRGKETFKAELKLAPDPRITN